MNTSQDAASAELLSAIHLSAGTYARYLHWLYLRLRGADGAAYVAPAADVIEWVLEGVAK